jgi:predicted PurR-regulated permease PerM
MNVFRSDQFPFILLVIFACAAIVVFWSIMDMVLLGASLAIVLIPLHRSLSARTRPFVLAGLITLLTFAACGAVTYLTFLFFSANTETLTTMFASIAAWVEDPATNLLAYGIPISKGSLSAMLLKGYALFVDYQATVIEYLTIILFKIFVFFSTLFVLLLHGYEIKSRIMEHLTPPMNEYVTRLSQVTVDTLYAIYVVQVIIAVLTFFIALPVFWILGYGNILFFSFFAAFCELIPILGSSLAFIIIGAYAVSIGDVQGVFILFILGYVGLPSCGDLDPAGAGRPAGEDPARHHVHRYHRGYPHDGPCRLCPWPGHHRSHHHHVPDVRPGTPYPPPHGTLPARGPMIRPGRMKGKDYP